PRHDSDLDSTLANGPKHKSLPVLPGGFCVSVDRESESDTQGVKAADRAAKALASGWPLADERDGGAA
ncbi:MAG: hypothetical protein RLZZ450_6766, partial [Pseudomonadota bacterium]